MRVLFIAKSISHEPHGIMYLSSVLKQAGHEVKLAVSDLEDVITTARGFAPNIVGYTVVTGEHHYYLNLNRRIKQEIPVFSAFGGPHATFFPEMINEDGVDGVCIGEGEEAIVDLATVLEENREFNSQIPNWWFKRDEEIIRNPIRSLIADLDKLPYPDRNLLYSKDKLVRDNKARRFMTGRGCPFNCSFCFNHAYAKLYRGRGARLRRRSVDNVIAELQEVRTRYSLEFVTFFDDTFIVMPDWVAEFCEKYPRMVGLPFYCYLHVKLVNPDVIRQLKSAGCVAATFGIETADEHIRAELLNRRMTNDEIIRAADLLYENDINLITTNMIGLPTSTLQNDFATLNLNVRCRSVCASCSIYQPYPRTEMGKWVEEQGLLKTSIMEMDTMFWEKSYLKFPPAQERQIQNLQRLFGIGVEYPFLLPLIRLLIKLPPNLLFRLLSQLWRGYATATRVSFYRRSLREWLKRARHYLQEKIVP